MSTDTTIAMREGWLNGFADGARPMFEAAGFPLPPNLRISIGLPPAGYRSREKGFIAFPEASQDGHFEIFISPKTEGGDAVLAEILTRFLMYAATGSLGHQDDFKALARALGMVGKLRDCTAGELWFSWAAPVIAALGPMDFAPLEHLKPKKVQTTWGIKVHCPDCGWLARVSAKHITAHTHLNCPVPDCGGIMITALEDTGEAE